MTKSETPSKLVSPSFVWWPSTWVSATTQRHRQTDRQTGGYLVRVAATGMASSRRNRSGLTGEGAGEVGAVGGEAGFTTMVGVDGGSSDDGEAERRWALKEDPCTCPKVTCTCTNRGQPDPNSLPESSLYQEINPIEFKTANSVNLLSSKPVKVNHLHVSSAAVISRFLLRSTYESRPQQRSAINPLRTSRPSTLSG